MKFMLFHVNMHAHYKNLRNQNNALRKILNNEKVRLNERQKISNVNSSTEIESCRVFVEQVKNVKDGSNGMTLNVLKSRIALWLNRIIRVDQK